MKEPTDTRIIMDFMGVREKESHYDSYGLWTPIYSTSYLHFPATVFSKSGLSEVAFEQNASFDKSWDWLLPVINQILDKEKTSFSVDTVDSNRVVSYSASFLGRPPSSSYSMLTACYCSVLEFLKFTALARSNK